MITSCIRCGVPLPAGLGRKRQKAYCGKECRRQARLSREQSVVSIPCGHCGQSFATPKGKNGPRRHCSSFCMNAARDGRPLCVVEGCTNPRQYAIPAVCNSCYYRHRRTGTYERKAHTYRGITSHGYVSVANSTHPMATTQGKVYEHRMVLYDAIGPGPHPCHWCGDMVNWIKQVCSKGALVPDHLDGNKANNALTNLVAACNRCNSRRGLLMKWVSEHADDPVLWAMYERARGAA